MAKKNGYDYKEKIGVISGVKDLLKAIVSEDMSEELRDVSITSIDLLMNTCMEMKTEINKQFEYYSVEN